MKWFLITFGVCALIVAGVYFYAQTREGETFFWTKDEMMTDSQGNIKGAKQKNANKKQYKPIPTTVTLSKKQVYLWGTQKITIKTKAGAEVRVEVTYPNHSKNNNGTRTAIADQNGLVEYWWSIKGYKNYGTAKVKVVATKNKRVGEAKAKFKIIRYR